jgi:hypothetical protein
LTASMPTNRTTPTTASARVQRLAIEALKAADQLIARPLNEFDAELHLAPPMAIITMVLDHLEDGLYRAEKLDQSHRTEDLRVDRLLAGT